MKQKNGFRVVVGEYKNSEYRNEQGFGPSLKLAKAAEEGLNLRLNHSEFYSFIEHLENGKVIDIIETQY